MTSLRLQGLLPALMYGGEAPAPSASTITPEGIVVREIHPEFTFEQMQAATEAKLILDPNWKPMNI